MEVDTNVFEFVASHVFVREQVDASVFVDCGAYVVDYAVFVVSCFFTGLS